MTLAETLEQLGVDEKQAKVYLAALELGTATIQELAHHSGIKRTSIYNFLEDMKRQGLVSEMESNKKVLIIASDPHQLVKRAEERLSETRNILPSLLAIFNQPGEKPKVRYLEGISGIRAAYDDMIKTGEMIYAFSDFEKMLAVMPTEEMFLFPLQRVEHGIKFYSITKDGPWTRYAMARNDEQLREMKFVEDAADFETEINIYGNKVAMISFRRPYATVIVEDRAISQTLRSSWKLLWQRLPAAPRFDKADYPEYPTEQTSDSPSPSNVDRKDRLRPGKKIQK